MATRNKHGRTGVKRENPAKAQPVRSGYTLNEMADAKARGFEEGFSSGKKYAIALLRDLLEMNRAKDIHTRIEAFLR